MTTSNEDDWNALYPNWTHLDDIWNDSNIDLIQVHHYRTTAWGGGLEVYNRDQAVSDLIGSLRNEFGKPVFCAEFGIGDQRKGSNDFEHPDACWTLDGYDPVNSSALFNPTLSSDHRDDHLNEGTHLHNLLWSVWSTDRCAVTGGGVDTSTKTRVRTVRLRTVSHCITTTNRREPIWRRWVPAAGRI